MFKKLFLTAFATPKGVRERSANRQAVKRDSQAPSNANDVRARMQNALSATSKRYTARDAVSASRAGLRPLGATSARVVPQASSTSTRNLTKLPGTPSSVQMAARSNLPNTSLDARGQAQRAKNKSAKRTKTGATAKRG